GFPIFYLLLLHNLMFETDFYVLGFHHPFSVFQLVFHIHIYHLKAFYYFLFGHKWKVHYCLSFHHLLFLSYVYLFVWLNELKQLPTLRLLTLSPSRSYVNDKVFPYTLNNLFYLFSSINHNLLIVDKVSLTDDVVSLKVFLLLYNYVY